MGKRSSKQVTMRGRLLKSRGPFCEICGYPRNLKLNIKGNIGPCLDLHHIVAVQDGGTFDEENLIILCEKCHAESHGKIKKNYIDPYRKYYEE